MGELLVQTPTAFIGNLTPFESHFIIFCATTLGTITIVWTIVYIFLRPIPNHDLFAPLENLSRRWMNFILLLVSVLSAKLASDAFKLYFKIARPEILNFNFHPLITLSDYGFPSSHAATFAALATTLFLIHRRAGVYAGILALIICSARILAGVHTPLDILGGYLLGVLIGTLFGFIASVVSRNYRKG